MSISKRILFERDPNDDAARAEINARVAEAISDFSFKVPLRRKNQLSASPRWDPFWPNCVMQAAKDLGVKVKCVNDQVCTRTREEAVGVKKVAESIWKQELEEFSTLCAKR
ncbi:hypothetical protein [Ensifer adhaerens]|uniref:hypothetical protein n=1 Tax=Ensifer adhaerens TaxID=106592 RepID=UPI003F87C32D